MATRTSLSRSTLIRAVRFGLSALTAILLMLMMVLTFTDVIGRYFLNNPVTGSYELTEVLLALMVFSALPLATLENEHITVSLFEGYFKGALKKLKDLVTGIIMTGVLGVITWRLSIQAQDLMSYGDASMYLRIPYAWLAYFMTTMAAISTLFSFFLTLLTTLPQQQAGVTP